MSTRDEQIEKLKYELVDRYIIFMMIILGIYAAIFTFYIYDEILRRYLGGGIIFLGYSYLLVRKKFLISTIVHCYLITAPLYNFYVMLAFWDSSVASFCWLLPIPLGANIFFNQKVAYYYTFYTLLIIVIGYILANSLNLNFPKHNLKEVINTDTILIVSNILVVAMLVYYKDKIRKLETSYHSEYELETEKIVIKEFTQKNNDVDNKGLEKIFSKIEESMNENMFFKDIKFNLSMLSVAININSNYISKAIRFKGYPNFNNYLNIYRIKYVKKLLTEVDFQKKTLMYVYTEAGFSNQSTFNRVFKQIEGITPSEYFQNTKRGSENNI
ncbi:helix-turn-helix domain-containing protein [Chryseobacterium sp. YIM B08800]|uniref:helix-turn-helix domain-containing protein n=1 Tax=Chryseobacterium sp. YIM B08800 TaxID=2984136 RepID=UPI00223FCCFA|nr:helix-turn-helix domain-containing protein [Chryseobacterium sp. YIM B08800]